MKITRILVRAGRTFNHPHEQYSNLRPGITLEGELAEGDDPIAAVKELQAHAEQLVEDHKQNLLKSIEELYQMSERKAEIVGLQRQLGGAQRRLDEIRGQYPELAEVTESGSDNG